MKTAMKKKGDSAVAELSRTYEMLRDQLADRLDEIDARALGSRAYSYSKDLRQRVEGRVRPQPKRRFPIAALIALGAAVGIGVLLYDRRRRDMVQGRLTQLKVRTQERMPGMGNGLSGAVDNVMGKVRGGAAELDEQKLKTGVEASIAEGGQLPEGLQVAVEGRTVYLRGTVDPAIADQAAVRAQSVEGVAAVVNLTAAPQAKPTTTGRRA
ncbi:MAG: BON domain-containing protein [Chloroflexota bacterium]